MFSRLTIRDFHQRFQKRLQMSFISGQVGLDQEINPVNDAGDNIAAVDYLNVIRPPCLVVIGQHESEYLASLSMEQRHKLLLSLFADGPAAGLVLSRHARLSEATIKYCTRQSIPVFQSQLNDSELLNDLRYFLNQTLAEKTTEHGVFIEVHSIGVFITGESGVGKSELALSLISRGHRLIADDITQFTRIASDAVDGTHPGLFNDFLEVRGLGILNVRAMFGANSMRRNKILRMIVNMVHFTPENSHKFDRLGSTEVTRNILGVDIPELTLPVAPGRNLAVMVEVAARNHILKMNGYNAAEDFIERQRRAIKANASG